MRGRVPRFAEQARSCAARGASAFTSRIRIIEVAEPDRLCRTGRLARRHHLAVADGAILLFGGAAGAADALDAIGAFLHDAARAHRDVGIERGL